MLMLLMLLLLLLLLLLQAKHAQDAQVTLSDATAVIHPKNYYSVKFIITWLMHWQPCAPA